MNGYDFGIMLFNTHKKILMSLSGNMNTTGGNKFLLSWGKLGLPRSSELFVYSMCLQEGYGKLSPVIGRMLTW